MGTDSSGRDAALRHGSRAVKVGQRLETFPYIGELKHRNSNLRWDKSGLRPAQRMEPSYFGRAFQLTATHGCKIWCQRRDSNSQTPVSKTGRYSNSRTLATWCTGEDLNLRVPLGETGLQPVRFGLAHAPVQTWLKVEESNIPTLITMPWFSVAAHSIPPAHGGEWRSRTC